MAKEKPATSDIDRLIEMGLNRYGAGDLDGAMFLWEEALAIDPQNAQATSYIDYVRLNYDLLNGEPSVEEEVDAKYPIEEEPEYQIEILPGGPAAPQAPPPVALDPVDDGWFVDEETHDSSADPEAEGGTLEMEADEPLEMEADEPPASALNFDSGDTRDYPGNGERSSEPVPPKPADHDLDDGTAGPTTGFFRGDETAFASGMARSEPPLSAPDDDDAASEFGEEPATGGFNQQGTPLGFSNLETEVRKRDFGFVQPASPIAIGNAQTQDNVAFDATQERSPFMGAGSFEPADPTADDLLDSLPTPRPAEPESGEIRLTPSTTRDMPPSSRTPARLPSASLSQAEVMLSQTPTRELSPSDVRARADNPVLTAPTRELGLRPGGRPPTGDSMADEDAPTGQADVRAIRAAAAARNEGVATARNEGTRQDIVLPFDPIVAAGAQILDEIDTEAPSGESREDQTRRRITRLLEKAGDWAEGGELDKAVTAVDLALSEDPNSALAQKLVTRNKETVMQLFQGYLGNLDRTPQLAKPLHELASAPISPRAAFLLSRIDGMLTIDELLDVSGMPRLEAYRYLCQLFLRGILR